MENKHTPGPWYYDFDCVSTKPRREGLNIALCTAGNTQGQFKANAKLIAAAPDLLEACQYAFQNLRPRGNIKKDFSGHNAIAALSRAIQNATE